MKIFKRLIMSCFMSLIIIFLCVGCTDDNLTGHRMATANDMTSVKVNFDKNKDNFDATIKTYYDIENLEIKFIFCGNGKIIVSKIQNIGDVKKGIEYVTTIDFSDVSSYERNLISLIDWNIVSGIIYK